MSTHTPLFTAQDERVNDAVLEQRPETVAHLFRDRVAKSPNAEAFRFAEDDSWSSVTWTQVRERAYRLAAGLVALGVHPEDRVAIASSTRYEWALTDLAVMCAGGATTTIYPTTIAPDVAYILANSGSVVVYAEDDDQIAKLWERRVDLPGLVPRLVHQPPSRNGVGGDALLARRGGVALHHRLHLGRIDTLGHRETVGLDLQAFELEPVERVDRTPAGVAVLHDRVGGELGVAGDKAADLNLRRARLRFAVADDGDAVAVVRSAKGPRTDEQRRQRDPDPFEEFLS